MPDDSVLISMAENLLKLSCKVKQKASKMMKGKQTNTKYRTSNQPKKKFSQPVNFAPLPSCHKIKNDELLSTPKFIMLHFFSKMLVLFNLNL